MVHLHQLSGHHKAPLSLIKFDDYFDFPIPQMLKCWENITFTHEKVTVFIFISHDKMCG